MVLVFLPERWAGSWEVRSLRDPKNVENVHLRSLTEVILALRGNFVPARMSQEIMGSSGPKNLLGPGFSDQL